MTAGSGVRHSTASVPCGIIVAASSPRYSAGQLRQDAKWGGFAHKPGNRHHSDDHMVEWTIVKKLIAQIAKFGVVGVIAFLLDFGILNILVRYAHMNNVTAGTISFLVSLAVNYLLSMKMVFKHRDDMARWMEITIFFISAAVGLLINDVVIWTGTASLPADAIDSMHGTYVLYTNIAKIVATVIVSIWNFIIRKWLLDAPTPGKPVNTRSFAHRLGHWSLSHNPFDRV
ncbi:putative flippase GtrA [Bifidobacterium psychraerophilum DSM 22366]|nr:putative flippase GtrA [Bifidobacterium psychraerophilum DSM 22366]